MFKSKWAVVVVAAVVGAVLGVVGALTIYAGAHAAYTHVQSDDRTLHQAVMILNYNIQAGKLAVPPELLPPGTKSQGPGRPPAEEPTPPPTGRPAGK